MAPVDRAPTTDRRLSGVSWHHVALGPPYTPSTQRQCRWVHGSMHARHPNWVVSYLDNRSTARNVILRIGVVGLIGEFILVEPCISYYLSSRVAHPRTHLHYLWVNGVYMRKG